MPFKEFTFFGVLKRSPVLRSGRYACKILQTVLFNVLSEIMYAPMGVRRIDSWKENPDFLRVYNQAKNRTA